MRGWKSWMLALGLTAGAAGGALALDTTFPTDIAGIRFGQPSAGLSRACTSEGGRWTGRDCELGSGTDAMIVSAESCARRRVCRVSMIETDRFPAGEVTGWVERFRARKQTLTERYGEPRVVNSRAECASAVLERGDATCIASESGNSVSVSWDVAGGRVKLRLYKNDGRRMLHIEERYESPVSVAEEASQTEGRYPG